MARKPVQQAVMMLEDRAVPIAEMIAAGRTEEQRGMMGDRQITTVRRPIIRIKQQTLRAPAGRTGRILAVVTRKQAVRMTTDRQTYPNDIIKEGRYSYHTGSTYI